MENHYLLLIRITLIVLSFVKPYSMAFAQVEDYYAGTENLSGQLLKNALYNIIKGHETYNYTSFSIDVWDILKETDADPNNPENVILLYTGWTRNAEGEYDRGRGWTREHVWAKSHGDFGIDRGAGTDVHALRPSDVTVNSARNNKDFDEGGDFYIDGDGPTKNRSDSDSWEPRDLVKGDVARSLFYMAVRYEGENGEPDLELVDSVLSVSSNEPGKGYHGKLSALLKWHYQDPVDSSEIRRNDIVYIYQGNRNPFIDHPEYVAGIWDTSGVQVFFPPDTVATDTLLELTDTLNLDSVLFAYYADLELLEGDTLKSILQKRIGNHITFPYTSGTGTDVWDILKKADQDSANPENIILFYTGVSVNGEQEFNNGRGWSRELIWNELHGDLGTAQGAGTDLHHIRAAGLSANRTRGDKDFDNGGDPFLEEDIPTGNFFDEDSWEPRDEIKGNIARMLFYMDLRYSGHGNDPDLRLIDEVNTVRKGVPGIGFMGKLSTLLQWHKNDPVDSLEKRRNNIVYAFQRNRNPFIDHPEYVYRLWDTLQYDTSIDAYYARIDTSLRGDALKSSLNQLIRDQVIYNYTDNDETDVWDILKISDRDPDNPENIILFYTGWSVNAAQEYNGGRGWSREDIWSNDHGNISSYRGVGTDVHAIRPVDISVNRARKDKDFDNGGAPYIDGDGATGCFTDNDSWEPRNEVKGDVARMLFYMATRYEGVGNEPDLELLDTVMTASIQEDVKGYHGKRSTLLQWHQQDPVDRIERNRNQVIFNFQGNRNPYIDHPEFVSWIWSIEVDTVATQTPTDTSAAPVDTTVISQDTSSTIDSLITSINAQNIKEISWNIYPNPADNQFTVTSSSFNPDTYLYLTDLRGTVVFRRTKLGSTSQSIQTIQWPSGMYYSIIERGTERRILKLFIIH